MMTVVPLFMMPGGPELLIIFFLAVLLFGSAKLPGLARAAGESMGEFQKGRESVERELRELRESTRKTDQIDELESDTETEPEVV